MLQDVREGGGAHLQDFILLFELLVHLFVAFPPKIIHIWLVDRGSGQSDVSPGAVRGDGKAVGSAGRLATCLPLWDSRFMHADEPWRRWLRFAAGGQLATGHHTLSTAHHTHASLQ